MERYNFDIKKMIGKEYAIGFEYPKDSIRYDTSLPITNSYLNNTNTKHNLMLRREPLGEFPITLKSNTNNFTSYQNKRGKIMPFCNATFQTVVTHSFEMPYGKSNSYEFKVWKDNKIVSVFITETQFSKAHEIIEEFQKQAQILFIANMNDKQCGELLRRYLATMITDNKPIHHSYWAGWEIKNDTSISFKKADGTYNFSAPRYQNNILCDNNDPAQGCRDYCYQLSTIKNKRLRCLCLSYLVVSILHTLLREEFIKPIKILVFEGDSNYVTSFVKHFFSYFKKHINGISSLDSVKNIDTVLFDAKDEIVIFNDSTASLTERKKESRQEAITHLINIHKGVEKIRKFNSKNELIYQKDLDAMVAVISNSIFHENFDTSYFYSIEIGDDDIDLIEFQKNIKNRTVISTFVYHFINYCETNFKELQLFITDNYSSLMKSDCFEDTTSLEMYIYLILGIRWFERFATNFDINIKEYIPKYEELIKSFIKENEGNSTSGYAMYFKKKLLSMIQNGEIKLLPITEMSIKSNVVLAIYYDDNYLYFERGTFDQKLRSILPSHIKIKHILEDLYKQNILVAYSDPKISCGHGDFTYSTKVTICDNPSRRIQVIKLKRTFIDDDYSYLS